MLRYFVCVSIGVVIGSIFPVLVRNIRGYDPLGEIRFNGDAAFWASKLSERLIEKPVSQENYDNWLWGFKDEELRNAMHAKAFEQGYMFALSRHQIVQLTELCKAANSN